MTTDPLAKSRDPLLGQRIDGRYLVQGVLGRGGMGVVYDGLHEQLGRPVAIKVLGAGISGDPIAVKRFLREAQTASQLTHGNIVDVSDLGVLDDGRPYLVMPKVHGIDLAALLVKQGPQTPRRTAELLFGAAAALDLIHAKGFVHRDVKPENLMHVVREDGSETTLLLDFGIVGLVSARSTRLTAEGSVFGTPAYLPPEVIQGATPDRRADVYALATVAFELMSGRSPFEAENPLRILPMKIMGDAPGMGQISGMFFPPSIESVIARGLTRDPELRWPSAGEFVGALDSAVLDVELATGEIEPQSRSAVLRRTATAERTQQTLIDRGSAPLVDPSQLEAARYEQLILDAERLRAEHESAETEVTPLPPLPASNLITTTIKTEELEAVGAHTLSVEFRASQTAPLNRKRRKWLFVGVAAGTLLTAGFLTLWAMLDGEPTHLATPGPLPLAVQAPVQPSPSAAAQPEPAEPAGALPSQPAAQPTAAGPVRTNAKRPRAEVRPRLQPAAETASPELRAERGRVAVKPDVRPSPAAAKPPGAPMLSATDLVQAAARELIAGHLGAAADLYAQATRLDPKSEPAYRGLGLTNERLGKKAEAIKALTRALALAPNGQNAAMLKVRLERLQASQ